MGNAILPEEATLYIGVAGAASSACLDVTSEITNFSESGGEEDTESVPVFGGGNIDKTKPRTQIEVSFDVILRYNADSSVVLKWDSYKFGDITTDEVTSAGNAESKAIYLQFTDGTENYTRAYNNAKAVSFEPETPADDMLKGTITFKCSPTTADGLANLKIKEGAASTITWA